MKNDLQNQKAKQPRYGQPVVERADADLGTALGDVGAKGWEFVCLVLSRRTKNNPSW